MPERDDDREVELAEDLEILPDASSDDTDVGWGEIVAPRGARGTARQRVFADHRLLDERPPHWD